MKFFPKSKTCSAVNCQRFAISINGGKLCKVHYFEKRDDHLGDVPQSRLERRMLQRFEARTRKKNAKRKGGDSYDGNIRIQDEERTEGSHRKHAAVH